MRSSAIMTSGNIALLVVGIVLGVLAIQAAIWIPLLGWMRRRSARLVAALNEELAASGEPPIRGPESALYRGSSGSHSRVKGNGVLALTSRRLIFHKLVGQPVEVPLDQIVGLREDKWFLGAYRSGRPHVILQLREGGEVGFMVRDHTGWMEAMRRVTRVAAA